MEVDTVCIPPTQTVNGKGMAQVIGACPDAAFLGFQPGQLEENTERASCGLNRKSALVHADEKACIRV